MISRSWISATILVMLGTMGVGLARTLVAMRLIKTGRENCIATLIDYRLMRLE